MDEIILSLSLKETIILTPCPHCFEEILVYPNEVNCGIFRHAVFISEGGAPGEPIPPHSSKEVCERLVEEGKVYGCGKPFRLLHQEDGKMIAEICDWI